MQSDMSMDTLSVIAATTITMMLIIALTGAYKGSITDPIFLLAYLAYTVWYTREFPKTFHAEHEPNVVNVKWLDR